MKKQKFHFKSLLSSLQYFTGIFFKSNQENMDETSYLLNTPANAKRLLTSIDDYKKGRGQERTLIE